MSNRIPPHDLDAEASVLGAMLENYEAVAACSEILRAEDFFQPKNRDVFEAILRAFTAGDPIDAVTIADSLARNRPEVMGDIRVHIAGLIHDYPTASAARKYARVVADCSALRRLVDAGNRIMELGFSMPEDAAAAVADAEWAVLGATRASTGSQEPTRQLAEWLSSDQEYIEELGKLGNEIVGLAGGMPTLDQATHGWQPGQLIVIGAQSGHGKTTVLQHFATTAAAVDKSVLLVSLEMSGLEMRRRIYAADATLNHSRLMTGDLDVKGWSALHEGMARMNKWPLFLNDRKRQTSADIAADARRVAARSGGLDLLVVDYLQYVTPQDWGIPREQQVGRIARDLKDIAGLLECPVITGCQLNDQVNHRADKRPTMTDIRESKGIEHTSDVILFGYWPWRHDPTISIPDPSKKWSYELILAKHRQGVTDMTIPCTFKAWCYSIAEDGGSGKAAAEQMGMVG